MKPFSYIILFLLLAGCQSYPKKISSVNLSRGVKLPLLPANNWPAVSVLQKLEVKWGKQSLNFKVIVEVKNNTITMAGLTPVMSRSFLITYKSGMLNFKEHPYFRYPFKPENMLADFHIAFAPQKQLKKYFQNSDLNFQSPVMSRKISKDGKTVIEVKYKDSKKWPDDVILKNYLNNYELKIQTLQYEAL